MSATLAKADQAGESSPRPGEQGRWSGLDPGGCGGTSEDRDVGLLKLDADDVLRYKRFVGLRRSWVVATLAVLVESPLVTGDIDDLSEHQFVGQ